MLEPLVSIVIPVYNGENYLKDAIESALAQTYKHCEIIVVNDGSSDNTQSIALRYGNKIRYFYKENGGVSTALNFGISQMQGEYFTWLAHDDMFYQDKIQKEMDALRLQHNEGLIVQGNYDLLSVEGGTVSPIRQHENYTVQQLQNSVFPLLMTTLHASTVLIHKSHFERVGLFDEQLPLTQDYDFLFRAMRGQKTVFLQDALLVSRLHRQSNKNAAQFNIAAAKQYEQFLNALSYDEISDMFHSPRAFYFRIAAMIHARNTGYNLTNILSELKKLPEEKDRARRFALLSFLKQASGGKLEEICIFCCGYYGKILKYELECRGCKVDYFCDNDKNKQGKVVNSCICLSPKELEKRKDKTLVIIAADVTDVIFAQLKEAEFPFVITKTSIDPLILSCSPDDILKEFTV